MAEKQQGFLGTAYDHSSVTETYNMYEAWADTYDSELVENGYQQPIRCAHALKTIMPEASSILDIGCGTGLSGDALKKAGFSNIDGCDFSPAMLEKAKHTNAYNRLFQADLNKPPLSVADRAYDAVTVVGVFSMQHVKVEAMDDLLRTVRPGGAMVIGLNDKFYRQGNLCAKLDALAVLGRISQIGHEHGEHIPDIGLTGWVISLKILG
ncbi:MAG: class I SAM-dependent methyltransferase [Hyphomicrobiales bacterium]